MELGITFAMTLRPERSSFNTHVQPDAVSKLWLGVWGLWGCKLPIHPTDGGRGRLGLNSGAQGLQLQLRVNIDLPWENGGKAFYLAAVLLEGDALQGRRRPGGRLGALRRCRL
jgi:hypothetical protein